MNKLRKESVADSQIDEYVLKRSLFFFYLSSKTTERVSKECSTNLQAAILLDIYFV